MRSNLLLVWLALVPFAAAQEPLKLPLDPARQKAIAGWMDTHTASLVETYKHLHANPEISFQELKTAALIAKSLREKGWEVTEGVGRTGVVAVMKNGDGPTVLIRGDMDALPVLENTGLPYASKVQVKRDDGTTVGAMHACGHDIHCTLVIGAGGILQDLKDHWSGTVVLIAQPAEEIGQGAKAMIADGLFEKFPKPDFTLAMHVNASLPAGTLGYTSGYASANVDSVDITIFGKGGHGARPQDTVDPVLVSAHVITSLQSLVSRRISPNEPGVVTVGSIHGGTKHNIIPDDVKLQLTVRSYSDEVRRTLLDGIRQIAMETCRAFDCPKDPEVKIDEKEYTPAAYNDPALTAAAAELFAGLIGKENVIELPAEMGGEDFGRYPKHLNVPGLQYRVGTANLEQWKASRQPGGKPLPNLHSPLYYPVAEPSVRLTVESMANLAMAVLRKKS